MKKILTITIIVVMVMMVGITAVSAATSASLANELFTIGSKYGMTEADRVKIERYLTSYPVSNTDADAILSKAQDADQIMKTAGTTDYKSLPAATKSKLQTLAKEAATIVGVELLFKSGSIEIYKDGKLIETVSSTTGKLAYTGNDTNIALVVSAVAVIALATIIVTRKRIANAQ